MIFCGNGNIKLEAGEPALRSCWECNPAHEHLKTVNFLHTCFECGRYWIFDKFLDEFKSDEEFDQFFKKLGLQENQSTQTIDKGYRINVLKIESKDAKNEKENNKQSNSSS